MINYLGYFATFLTLLSFSFKNITRLRIVSSTSCVFWIVYGCLKNDYPIISTNVLIIIIHVYYLLKTKNK